MSFWCFLDVKSAVSAHRDGSKRGRNILGTGKSFSSNLHENAPFLGRFSAENHRFQRGFSAADLSLSLPAVKVGRSLVTSELGRSAGPSSSGDGSQLSSLVTMGRFAHTRGQHSPRQSINAGERIQTVVVALIIYIGGAFTGTYRLFSVLSAVRADRSLLASEFGPSALFFFRNCFSLSAEKAYSSSLATKDRRDYSDRFYDGGGRFHDGVRSGRGSRNGADSASARAETGRGRAFQRHHYYGFNPYGLRQTVVDGDKYLLIRRKVNVRIS
jgi:hypothetical protein